MQGSMWKRRQIGECENKLLCERHHMWRTQEPKQFVFEFFVHKLLKTSLYVNMLILWGTFCSSLAALGGGKLYLGFGPLQGELVESFFNLNFFIYFMKF